MTNNPINPVAEVHREIARKGGSAKTDRKKLSSKANAAKARASKLAYRLNPELRPNRMKEIPNGHS